MKAHDSDSTYILAYLWLISLLACVFLGHELAIMKHGLDNNLANEKLNQRHGIITGLK